MQEDIPGQIEALKTTGTAQLLTQYKELFGDKAAPGKRVFLIRQLAYRIQEQELDGISPSVRGRIQELIRTYDPINKIAVKISSGKTAAGRDARLPMPGSFITKVYKSKRIEVNERYWVYMSLQSDGDLNQAVRFFVESAPTKQADIGALHIIIHSNI